MNEQLQIEFLPVDSGEKSGDALVFRYGDFSHRSRYKVVIIDGGTKESGLALVEHIQKFYETNHVDLVICTHPDADHASGLRQVMNQCSVGELWIHKPWDHSEHICDLFHDGRITDNSLSERLQRAYTYAYQLVQLAEEKDIPIREPFAGRESEDGALIVLGPSTDYYRELIPDFARSPQARNFLERAYRSVESVVTWIQESLNIETLDENGETSAENRSSSVVLLRFAGGKYLFTGDSGIESLHKVIEYANVENIDISSVDFMQIPHHGSKRNISPSILNAIRCVTAYASASKESVKHPAKKVTNAFKRRNTNVFKTGGNVLCYQRNAYREGWGSAEAIPFYNEVEE